MSRDQQVQAVRVNNIPRPEFEAMVSANPLTDRGLPKLHFSQSPRS